MNQFKDWQFRENIMINAYTSPTLLAVNSTSHKNQFKDAFGVCCEMMFDPTFDQPVLDQEREVVLREITERRGDPEYIVYFHTMNQIFQKGSLDRHETLGKSECVAETSVDNLNRLHKSALSQSQVVISVTGGGIDLGFIEKTVQEYLDRNLKALAISDRKQLDFQPSNILKNNFRFMPIVHEQAHEQVSLSVFIPCDVSFDNWPTLRVFEELFLKYYGKLYGVLRDEKGFVYGLHSTFRHDTQNLELNLSCETKYVQPIIEEIKKVFANFEDNFEIKKLNELKKILELKVDLSSDSPTSINHFINQNLFTFGQFQSFENYEKRFESVGEENIKVIYNQIQAGLSTMQIVAVSKDTTIDKIDL